MITDLLTKLSARGINLKLVRENLAVDAPNGALTEGLLNEIRQSKAGIIGYLKEKRNLDTHLLRKAEKREYYKLSAEQKRMFFLNRLEPGNLSYNMVTVYPVDDPFDLAGMEEVIKKIIQRHESLRTCFCTIDNEPFQIIRENVDFKIAQVGCAGRAPDEIIPELIRPHDLGQAPLLRVTLADMGDKQLLLVDMHHMITDGISQDIILREIDGLINGHHLAPLALQYKDYAEYQNSKIFRDSLREKAAYWIREFSSLPPAINLPYDFIRPALKKYEGRLVRSLLGPSETAALRSLGKEQDATMFMVILSLFAILLSKLSGQEDIVIGVPFSVRKRLEMHPVIGMFINTLPVRGQVSGELTYRDFLEQTKIKCIEIFENQEYQFDDLVTDLKMERDASRNPLFETVLEFFDRREGKGSFQLPDDDGGLYHGRGYGQFDLTLNVNDCGDLIALDFDYSVSLFKPSSIDRYIGYFRKLAEDVCYDPDRRITDLSLLPAGERQELLHAFNDTGSPFPEKETIISLFEKQVESTPGNIALRSDKGTMTYRELNERAETICAYLQETEGVGRGDLVGVMLDRGEGLIESVFGILKAGAGYVPIDPHYPSARIDVILKDSDIKVLINREKYLEGMSFKGGSKDALRAGPDSRDIAYVIYTSGSTGMPKGVMVEHRSVINRLAWMQKKYPIAAGDVLLLKTPIVFDVSVWELFWWSFTGASLCLLEPGGEKDPKLLTATIRKNKVTTIHFVPSMLHIFLSTIGGNIDYADLGSLRQVFSSGEALKGELAYAFGETIHRNCGTRLINLYGPTEATVDVSCYECDFNGRSANEGLAIIPIGKPIDNIQLYILDKEGRPVPFGVAGELLITGVGVARGYLNNMALTREKFIPHPFVEGQVAYRTGDLARWVPDGNVEFLGRIDDQVKIRGFRIELGEIESQLAKYGGVRETVVVVKGKEADKHLVAYYTSENAIEAPALRAFLSERLPDHMVPGYYVHLDSVPLTTNGKIDRKALPEPVIARESISMAPSNDLEHRLAEVWASILQTDKEAIGVNSSFFEIGGHSLRATVLANKIFKEFKVELPLNEIFRSPDIRRQAQLIREAKMQDYRAIQPAPIAAYYSLSSAQKRLHFLQEFDRHSLAYNMPMVLKLEGKTDTERLRETFKKLIARHESLRTSFATIEGEVVQKISPAVDLEITCVQARPEEVDAMIGAFIRPFSLEQPPLLRAGLIETGPMTRLLMVDMHHSITDGVSQQILIRDFMTFYNGGALPDLPLQYKDYAAWQQDCRQQERLSAQKDFWLNELLEAPRALTLPADFPRPAIKEYDGNTLGFGIGPGDTEKLKAMAASEGATLFMVLLSLYTILLSRLGNQEDIVIGTPVAGRGHADLENIVGMFINTLPLRNYPRGNLRFREFLSELRSRTLACFDNQLYKYEEMIDALKVERDPGRNPLFDTMFMLQNFDRSELVMPGLSISPYPSRHAVSKFDLTLTAVAADDKIFFDLEYSTALFKEETITRFIGYFKNIVSAVISDPDMRIADIRIMDEAEKHTLLVAFNDTAHTYSKKETITGLFERQAEREGEKVAILSDGIEISYHELMARVNEAAARLNRIGVSSGEVVAILFERSPDCIIHILAILKNGAAYLPLDQDSPDERLNYILNDSNAGFLLTKRDIVKGKDLKWPGTMVLVDEDKMDTGPDPGAAEVENDNVYLIYTSGSTGRPKGVLGSRKGLLNRLSWGWETYPYGEGEVCCLKTSLSFVDHVAELFSPLLKGVPLVILSDRMGKDVEALAGLIMEKNISRITLVPSLLHSLLQVKKNRNIPMSSLRYVFCSGETLPPDLADDFYREFDKAQLINIYGSSEVGADSTWHPVWAGDGSRIGKPMFNTQVLILDPYGNLQPVGVPGEICVSGDGLANGYAGKPELTQASFVSNPYRENTPMFRTGDLGKWLREGDIAYLGRKDDQVKIRGFRIELEEITRRLKGYEGIREAVVVARTGEGSTCLVAYYTADKEAADIQAYLSEWLPAYMVPSRYVRLERFPLTQSGKINKKALPDPGYEAGEDYSGPTNDIEEKLVAIWSEVLEIEQGTISIHKSFFELGGHSLISPVLTSKIRRELEVSVQYQTLFRYPTISSMAGYILKQKQA